MYKSTRLWRDLTDNHLYQAGDTFPFDGRAVPADRINALLEGKNKAGFALIKAVVVEGEENPSRKAGTPKKAVRSRKKAG